MGDGPRSTGQNDSITPASKHGNFHENAKLLHVQMVSGSIWQLKSKKFGDYIFE